jgi:hypothetical protein
MLEWLTVKEELSRMASALERVATALERAVPPPHPGVEELPPDKKELYREILTSSNLTSYQQEVEDAYNSERDRGNWVDYLS